MTLQELLANPGLKLAALVTVIQLLSFGANYWLSRIFLGKTYRYLVAPGVIVHEYSHAIACILTGARIREVRVFEATGGRVVHEPPRLPFGQAVISMAPIFGAAVAVYLLAKVLLPDFVNLGELEIASIQIVVFAALAASITVTMAPSITDLRAGLIGWLGLCLLIGLGSQVPSVANYFDTFLGEEFERTLAVILLAGLILAAVTAAAAAGYLVLHRTSRRGTTYRVE